MSRFMVCPECSKKGVTLRLGRDDCFVCRYCGWSCYASGYDHFDVVRRKALGETNPNHPDAPVFGDLDASVLSNWNEE